MKKTWKRILMLTLAALWMFCVGAAAEEGGDNSLYSLGLENDGVQCDPEFYYSTLEYNVTVPSGTSELYLDPITSDPNASIVDISGTDLDENSEGTVYITVEAPNGARVSYALYVSSEAPAKEPETEKQTEKQTEDKEAIRESELRAQAESEEAARQEAQKKANEEKLTKLTTENQQLTDRLNFVMKVIYGLVAFGIVLLLFIINQSLRNKDLKDEVKDARDQMDSNYEFARKEQNMPADIYYAPMNGAPVNQPNQPVPPMRGAAPVNEAAGNVQAAFGNAPQKLQAQPAPGQVMAPAPEEEAPAAKPEKKKKEKKVSKRELKKQQKAVEEAQAVQASKAAAEATLVHSSTEEPDVDVDLIDL